MTKLTYESLKGNWATLLLATDNQGNIDFSKQADEIDILIATTPNGIYSNGTAGEFYSQTEEEFLKISELLATKCTAAGISFQIGVSHMSPQLSLQRLQAIRHLNPSAVQVILPDWFPVTMPEATAFLQRMASEANGIPLVLYNPPHAKKVLKPSEWAELKTVVPELIGVKVFDYNGDAEWYRQMNEAKEGLSIFVPGHNLATGVKQGAHGAYSNVACLNPFVAQQWYNQMEIDLEAALELEKRIRQFMTEVITPFIVRDRYPNHACDRFMALVGGWADVGAFLRWPYCSISIDNVIQARKAMGNIIPEFIRS